jgi:CubicO group peptidase (beta-lactamase class C family)
MRRYLIQLVLIVMALSLALQGTAHANERSTPSGVPLSALEATVDEIMQQYIGKDVPGLAVSVVKDGQIVFEKGYGYANLEKQLPVDPRTTYMEPGSVSKLFTWTAVMQLVEQGKLDLNQDIRSYLPADYLTLSYDEPVTLLHLMNHMAGFEERIGGLMVDNPDDLLPLEQYLGPGRQPKQIYRPGTTIAYSNFGTSLAGLIVERVSGMPFEQYVQEQILAPLEMQHSFFDPDYSAIPGVMDQKAVGYAKKGEEWQAQPNTYINDVPAGSLTSTASDLAHFMIAQMNYDGAAPYQLFNKPETLREMQTRSFSHHENLVGVAHGFWERYAGGHRVLEHGGNTNSFTALLAIVPEESFGISILTNVEGEMAGARIALINSLIGSGFSQPNADPALNHSAQVAGRYRSARKVESNLLRALNFISDSDTQISANPDGSIQLRIPAMGIDQTYVETAPYLYTRATAEQTMMDYAGLESNQIFFTTDASGKVIQLSHGTIMDQLPVSFFGTALFNLLVLAGSALVFLLGLIVAAFKWLRGRFKGQPLSKLQQSTAWLALVGVGSIANLVVLITRMVSDPFQAMSNFLPQIVLFWLAGAATLWLGYRIVQLWPQTPNKLGLKLYTGLLFVSLIGLASFLVSNHFLLF